MKASFRAKTIEEQIDALSQTPNGQLLSASINARLVRDLSLVYDHPSYAQQLEHSLEHVEQRLQAQQLRRGNVAGSQQQRVQSTIPASLLPARKRERPQRAPSTSRPFVTMRTSFAALFCVAVLIG